MTSNLPTLLVAAQSTLVVTYADLTKPLNIQVVNRTVYRCSVPMPELRSVSKSIDRHSEDLCSSLAGSQCLFSPSFNSANKTPFNRSLLGCIGRNQKH